MLCEVTGVVAEAKFALDNLDRWVAPKSVCSRPACLAPLLARRVDTFGGATAGSPRAVPRCQRR